MHTIGKKLWMGFSILLVLLVIVSTLSIFSLHNVTNKYEDVINDDLKKVELADDIQEIQKDMGTALLEYIMFGRDEAIAKFEELELTRQDYTEQLAALATDEDSTKLLIQLNETNAQLFESNSMVMKLKKSGEDFSQYSSGSSKINVEVLAIIDEIITIQNTHAAEIITEVEQFKKSIIQFVILILIISVTIGLFIAYFISRGISKPVKLITDGLEEVSKGNLQIAPISVNNKDEIGEMAKTFNIMLSDLKNIVQSTHDTSVHLAANAEQLSSSTYESLTTNQRVTKLSEQQTMLSTEQQHYVQETVQAIATLENRIDEITKNSNDMYESTTQMKHLIELGSNANENVTVQMDAIYETFNESTIMMKTMAEHSDEIQQVTALITAIADQTNLLALNAAIEAARAGEAGKGFAVVADEVRHLAEQAKQSASNIAATVHLIQSASKKASSALQIGHDKVQDGLQRTIESKQAFVEIEESVAHLLAQVQSIASVSVQAHDETVTVTSNTEKVERLAHQVVSSANDTNASTEEQLAITEEISSSAQNLASLAETLQSKINHFKL